MASDAIAEGKQRGMWRWREQVGSKKLHAGELPIGDYLEQLDADAMREGTRKNSRSMRLTMEA